MSDFRPICDTWILARPKARYYGAYPSGFLERARALLGVSYDDHVLHVCGGKVRDYPFRGVGPRDCTLDLDPELKPDFLMDAREMYPGAPAFQGYVNGEILWPAVLADPPYSEADAAHYAPGSAALPKPSDLLKRCLSVVRPGGRVGFLDYAAPRPPKTGVRLVAMIGVIMGFGNKARVYSVYEKDGPNADAERKRALDAVRVKKPHAEPVVHAWSSDGYCDGCGEPTTMKNRGGYCPKCSERCW